MKKVKVKSVSNISNVKEMKKMLKEMLGPEDNNRHIYFDKIIKLKTEIVEFSKTYDGVVEYLGYPKDSNSILTDEDLVILERIEDHEDTIRKELSSKLQQEGRELNCKLNNIDLLFSAHIKTVPVEDIIIMSDFTSGFSEGSVVEKITKFHSEKLTQFKDIFRKELDECTLTDLEKAFADCTERDESLKIFNIDIWREIAEARYEDNKTYLKQVLKLIKMLVDDAAAIYNIIIVPEIDVFEMKEMIENAIKEFKKQVNNCDLAFEKLLKSLDIFIEKFDTYYAKFVAEGKDPMVFFMDFIEDVKKEYENTDKKGCRDILREFRNIELEFGKKITKNMGNPYIKGLYDSLCEQMDTASKMMDTDEFE